MAQLTERSHQRPVANLKAHSHSPQRSADSPVDCVNAEIGIFLSLWSNADARGKRSNVNEPLA